MSEYATQWSSMTSMVAGQHIPEDLFPESYRDKVEVVESRLVHAGEEAGQRVMIEVRGIEPGGRVAFHIRRISQRASARRSSSPSESVPEVAGVPGGTGEGGRSIMPSENDRAFWKLRGMASIDFESKHELIARERDFDAWMRGDKLPRRF